MSKRFRLAAVLLAAGPSRRLGTAKQLVEVGGQTLVRRTAGLLLEAGLENIIVVSGCRAQDVVGELSGLDVIVAHNRDWAQGMGASISCGVSSVPRMTDGVLVTVCDQYRLQLEDLIRLKSAFETDISRIIVSEWYEGNAFVSGPPVIFPRRYIPEMKFLIKNEGARQVIDRHMDVVEFVRVDNAAFDLDRPEDLAKIPREE